jgi:hypothetical protein
MPQALKNGRIGSEANIFISADTVDFSSKKEKIA